MDGWASCTTTCLPESGYDLAASMFEERTDAMGRLRRCNHTTGRMERSSRKGAANDSLWRAGAEGVASRNPHVHGRSNSWVQTGHRAGDGSDVRWCSVSAAEAMASERATGSWTIT